VETDGDAVGLVGVDDGGLGDAVAPGAATVRAGLACRADLLCGRVESLFGADDARCTMLRSSEKVSGRDSSSLLSLPSCCRCGGSDSAGSVGSGSRPKRATRMALSNEHSIEPPDSMMKAFATASQLGCSADELDDELALWPFMCARSPCGAARADVPGAAVEAALVPSAAGLSPRGRCCVDAAVAEVAVALGSWLAGNVESLALRTRRAACFGALEVAAAGGAAAAAGGSVVPDGGGAAGGVADDDDDVMAGVAVADGGDGDALAAVVGLGLGLGRRLGAAGSL